MNLKYFVVTIFMSAFFMLFTYQLSAQQYYKVVKGNDNPATAEKVYDDVSNIDDLLKIYKIDIAKTETSKENYTFWVNFLSTNKLPVKRKEIIYTLLKEIKTELK